MHKVPNFITFTGIDDRTDLTRIVELSERYFIEWGVLMGGRIGKNRYPSDATIQKVRKTDIQLSLHLCGKLAQSFLKTGEPPCSLVGFQRVQINAREYPYAQISQLRSEIPIVLQCRSAFILVPMKGITWLHDESGGKGRIPTERPVQPANYPMVGYAGGIRPENVLDIISTIEAHDFYIDMETGVRTDDWLDLDKCEAICKSVYRDK